MRSNFKAWLRTGFLAGFLTLLASSHVSRALAGPAALVYECRAGQMLRLSESGALQTDDWTALIMSHLPELTFVTTDGSARWMGNLWTFRIIQRGSASTDLVAVREFRGPATNVVWVLRIRPWKTPMPFLLVSEDETFSGTCLGR